MVLGIADFDAADEAGGTAGPDRAAGAVPRSGASGILTAAGTVGEGQPAGPDGRPARDRPAGSAQLADGEWPAGSERPGAGRSPADQGGQEIMGGQEITGSQEMACAGHPLPLVLRSAAAMPEAAADPQPLLGVIEGLTFSIQTLDLDRGDLLLAMTDGITHRRHGYRLPDDGDGVALLLAESRDLSAGAVAARIQQAARDFGPAPLADDMALLVLRAS